MHASRPVLAACAAALLFGSPGASLATDFIRGDSNSDGKVTISDAVRTLAYLFLGGTMPECLSSGDSDDNGYINLTDAVMSLKALFLNGPPHPSPFPEPGPDPTPNEDAYLDCNSYGNGPPPLDDSATILRIASAVAQGGASRDATITLVLTTTRPQISAYSGIIRGTEALFEDGPDGINGSSNADANHEELTGTFSGGWRGARIVEGKLQFSMVLSFTESKEFAIGDAVPIARLRCCLEPGTPAGEYPLVLEEVELSGCFQDIHCGRAVHPSVEGGVLVVQSDVTGDACDPFPEVPVVPPINVRFSLEERSGNPGGDVTLPFAIRSDRASQGFSYSVHFDENVIEATGTDKIFQTAGGTPYAFERFEENNDTGFVVGAAVISLTDTGAVLPPGQDVTVLEFDFHIDEQAPVGSTELVFQDGGQGTGEPVRNKLIASGQDITPDLASSFVFLNGLINIVPDGTPFVRADSNGDRGINIADAVFTLNHLFLGAAAPDCEDAADANDDGTLNITDPVATLEYLFRGTFTIPAPFGAPGRDPTQDELGCAAAP